MLIHYIRDENYVPFGVVVAENLDGNVRYGVSLCKPGDKWDRKLGQKIALGRLQAGVTLPYNVPSKKISAVLSSLRDTRERSKRWFKDVTFTEDN